MLSIDATISREPSGAKTGEILNYCRVLVLRKLSLPYSYQQLPIALTKHTSICSLRYHITQSHKYPVRKRVSTNSRPRHALPIHMTHFKRTPDPPKIRQGGEGGWGGGTIDEHFPCRQLVATSPKTHTRHVSITGTR